MDNNITSANATAILTVDELFPAGITLQQFSTDQAIAQDSMQVAETRMGVDGKMVAGYTPGINPVTINLEASSPSAKYLETVRAAMDTNRTIYNVTLVVTVPSISTIFTWTGGVMQTATPFPSLKKVLDPTEWVFHFEKLERATY